MARRNPIKRAHSEEYASGLLSDETLTVVVVIIIITIIIG
jgi:hypothetical protein